MEATRTRVVPLTVFGDINLFRWSFQKVMFSCKNEPKVEGHQCWLVRGKTEPPENTSFSQILQKFFQVILAKIPCLIELAHVVNIRFQAKKFLWFPSVKEIVITGLSRRLCICRKLSARQIQWHDFPIIVKINRVPNFFG